MGNFKMCRGLKVNPFLPFRIHLVAITQRYFLPIVVLLFIGGEVCGSELISKEDARKVLNTPQNTWNKQVRTSSNAGFSAHQESYDGTLRQTIRGVDWELTTYPIYGGVKSAPDTVEVKLTYKKSSPTYGFPLSHAEANCAKVFDQLKGEFSFLCAFVKTNDELRYTFLISKPGNRKDIDALNAKGLYTYDLRKAESDAGSFSKKLIPMYWAQLDAWAENRTASKEELINSGTSKLPEICSKLVYSYALASGKSPNSSPENREDWEFNSDVCVKATVHRRFPQPEFQNPKILDTLCHKQKAYEFNYNLCKRAGVLR